MASSNNEVMEIDSDDESPPKNTAKTGEKTDDEKALEIILIDGDSEEEKEEEKKKDQDKSVREEQDGEKGEKGVESTLAQPTSLSDSKVEKREPVLQPGIIDIRDDDDDEDSIQQMFMPKNDDDSTKKEDVIIKHVEEITQGGMVKDVEDISKGVTIKDVKEITQGGMVKDVEDISKGVTIKDVKEITQGVVIKDVEEITQNKSAGKQEEKKSVGRDKEDSDDSENEITLEEVDPEILANRLKCLNSGCKSGANLEICKDSFVFTFYGMKQRARQLVCQACWKAADDHMEELVSLLKEKKPLYTAKYPPCSDIVLLEDSDEENEEEFEGEELELSEEVMKIIENNDLLENLVKETMKNCEMDEQYKENKRLLEIEAERLEAEIKELDDRFSVSFKEMQRLQNLVYKDFQPRNESLSPVEIMDVQYEPPPPPVHNVKQGGLSSAASRMPLQHAAGQSGGARPVAVAMKRVTQYAASGSSTGQWRQSYGQQMATAGAAINSRQAAVANEQDVVALDSTPSNLPPLPPFGTLNRPKLEKGESVFVMRQSLFTAWGLAEVLEVLPKPSENQSEVSQIRVVYDLSKRVPPTKVTSAKLVAYSRPAAVRLPVGSRVIAVYRGDDDVTSFSTPGSNNNYFYSGIIAESPKINNKFRYLVFFDDGYTQYVQHENIRLVCESSKSVWDDVHPESKQFIKDYLTRYPERPMVKLNIDEIVKTEWNGKWWIARVQEIDASLAKMYFDADERTEWIYRGSTRLGPLYIEMMAARDRQSGKSRHASILKRQNPYVEYTQNLDESNSDDDVELVKASDEQQPSRSVARKSTNRNQKQNKSDEVYHKVGPVDISVKPKQFVQQDHPGSIVKVSLSNAMRPKEFKPHACNNTCVAWTKYTFKLSKEIPCLLRPLKFGFQRLFYTKKSKPFVVYIGPCGRRLRNHEEMIRYLFRTQSQLACDYFDFDPWVSCVNEFKLHKINTSIKDLSYGKENVSIECANYVDNTYPDFVYYQTERRAMENVNLNTDPEFLSGCDCIDNCRDRSKCSCWQLTINGAKCVPGLDFDENTIGYQYRRLPERVVSGIYECNSQCKCSSTCMNRVAQFPISVKLQLYKTLMKGWGIRCLHDIPQGSFICIYAGNLLTEQAANEGGKTYGDEYLAELDFIEVLENLKDDYESDVAMSSDEESYSNKNQDTRDYDDEEEEDVDDPIPTQEERDKRKGGYEMDRTFTVSSRINKDASSNMRDRLRARESGKSKARDSDSEESNDRNDDNSRIPSQFSANIQENEKRKHKSVRDYYGDDACIYIMDAKNGGNIGRYMNHSCNPNVFVQNVFVDTHDLRFPWVAFFASRFIEAGKELTWDYNYDVGSVPGKALHCYCGESNCRRRLL